MISILYFAQLFPPNFAYHSNSLFLWHMQKSASTLYPWWDDILRPASSQENTFLSARVVPSFFLFIFNDAYPSKYDHAFILQTKFKRNIWWQQPTIFACFKTHFLMSFTVCTNASHDARMKYDLVMPFVVPKRTWSDKWLFVPVSRNMAEFWSSQKIDDPSIILLILWQSLFIRWCII